MFSSSQFFTYLATSESFTPKKAMLVYKHKTPVITTNSLVTPYRLVKHSTDHPPVILTLYRSPTGHFNSLPITHRSVKHSTAHSNSPPNPHQLFKQSPTFYQSYKQTSHSKHLYKPRCFFHGGDSSELSSELSILHVTKKART